MIDETVASKPFHNVDFTLKLKGHQEVNSKQHKVQASHHNSLSFRVRSCMN